MSFNLKNKKCHLKNDKNDHVLQALMTDSRSQVLFRKLSQKTRVNITKFLRTPFLLNSSKRLLLISYPHCF